jgi:hypothetical protein
LMQKMQVDCFYLLQKYQIYNDDQTHLQKNFLI